MENNKTVSVWLKVNNGNSKNKIVLQKRSLENKAHAFICQSTWAGKVETGENPEDAVKRECEEEMGKKFMENFNFDKLSFLSKNDFEIKSSKWECYNYIGVIDEEILSLAEIHKEALPDFIFIDKNSKIYPIESGKSAIDNIVLFDDQYKVLNQILNGN